MYNRNNQSGVSLYGIDDRGLGHDLKSKISDLKSDMTMTHQYTVTGMTCGGCATTVQKALQKVKGIEKVSVNLERNEAEVTMKEHVATAKLQEALSQHPHYEIYEAGHAKETQRSKGYLPAGQAGAKELAPLPRVGNAPKHNTNPATRNPSQQGKVEWNDANTWSRASFNTLNCLIGCSIGDFAMIIYLQKYHPGTSMSVQMILAVAAGLATSVAFESILLRTRENFAWGAAFKTALSMSFISMVAMELVMNFTDFMITGGKAAFGNPMYWTALLISMAAGFLAPLPYNYYKLKKYNKACH